MEFQNRLKGQITQTIVRALLEHAGYKVKPVGIEEIADELRTLSREEYLALKLPHVYRVLPDFLVTTQDKTIHWSLEVKYRHAWNDEVKRELGKKMLNQAKQLGSLYLWLLIGQPNLEVNRESPVDWFGIVEVSLSGDGTLMADAWDRPRSWEEMEWDKFRRIQDVFQLLRSQHREKTLTKTVALLRALGDSS